MYRRIFHVPILPHFGSHLIMFTRDVTRQGSGSSRARGDLYLRIYFNINLCVATCRAITRSVRRRQTDRLRAPIFYQIFARAINWINAIYRFYYITGYLPGINICRMAGILRERAIFFSAASAHTCVNRLTCA